MRRVGLEGVELLKKSTPARPGEDGTRADGGFAAPSSRGNIPRKQPHGTATFGEAIMVLRFLPVLWTCWRGPDRVGIYGAPHARDPRLRGICCPTFARQYSQKTATWNSYIWGGYHGFEVILSF